ncbi:restriction endonuclease subunit S [Lachnospiraceae bacterium 46-61]
MANENAKPQIRFKGFYDDWEGRKLETITDVRDGTHDSPQYVKSGHPFITSKNVKNGFINCEDIQYISDKDYEEINKRSKVDVNDILMGMIGTIGNIALVRETPDFAIKNVALIKDTGDVFYCYLYHCLQSDFVVRQLGENLDGGTQKFIALNKIRELVIPVPSKFEQHKIGDYMESLNHIIALYQNKYDKLNNIKKSMIEKMFPKNGSNVPEIRFKGFSGDWEQRKLGEIADFSKGQGYTKSDLREVGTPIILYGRLYTKYQSIIREIDTFADIISGAVLSKGGEVILPSSGETAEDIAIATSVQKSGVLLGGGLNIVLPHKEIESDFLAIEISFGTPHNELVKQAQGKSIVHLYNEDLKKVVVTYPSIEEQQRIGAYFENFDCLIALHQRKLEKLKNIKNSMLKKMFV